MHHSQKTSLTIALIAFNCLAGVGKSSVATPKSVAAGPFANEPLMCFANAQESPAQQSIILVQGAGGSKNFVESFGKSCDQIRQAAEKAKVDFQWIGKAAKSTGDQSDFDQLKLAVEKTARR